MGVCTSRLPLCPSVFPSSHLVAAQSLYWGECEGGDGGCERGADPDVTWLTCLT